ncbi:LPXTG cell wall anchor domain-containing protein [Micromonospora sp. CPCC 205539]|uniref:LPXTG cell wall anchor domain-containing protein n=1 Tax=Micromonospora sp. CPCC 205539 TaxID=3122408 RepID=UPI002FEFF287
MTRSRWSSPTRPTATGGRSPFPPAYGKARKRTVKPGQTIEETFAGREGQTVTAGYDYWDPEADVFGPWEWEQPADCGGSGGGLPTTGAPAAGMAAGAGLLLSAGGALYLLARRRRIRFNA